MQLSRTVALFASMAATACFSPTYNNPACGPDGECPDGFTCVADVCQSQGDDDDDDDDDGGAPVDAAEPDAPPAGCYDEASEEANDSGAEGTGITIEGVPRTICGAFADRVPIGGVIDTDRYAITTTQPYLTVEISAPGASEYMAAALQVGMQGAPITDDAAEVSALFGGSTVQITVQASNAATLGQAVPYEITIRPGDPGDLCTSMDPPDRVEMLDTDSNMHTGNDVLTVTGTPALTPAPDDAPEPTGVILEPGTPLGVTGMAKNTAMQADQYKDRDTYVFVTGSTVNNITVNVAWEDDEETAADNADLDYIIATETPLELKFAGIEIGTSFEYGGGPVTPNTTYYLIIADWNDAQADKDYTVTVCGSK